MLTRDSAANDDRRKPPARVRKNTHPDGEIFRSFPCAGTINAGQILAEWGDAREVFDRPDAIAALAGTTPVTKASGKHRSVSFRWACNKRLRVAITTFAANSRFSSPWAADIYNRARASGRTTPTPLVSWREPGFGSCGAAGRAAHPTGPPCTAAPTQPQSAGRRLILS
ncbi:transposase [Amycolatopsis pithecellobii]|uniref:transposase n=1 Tax=Amycolatopsis pithecellobii TaxID=664692 RepID=UPI001AA0987A|nr:transposase [Amycolatopsis pithecellobii]